MMAIVGSSGSAKYVAAFSQGGLDTPLPGDVILKRPADEQIPFCGQQNSMHQKLGFILSVSSSPAGFYGVGKRGDAIIDWR